MNYFSLKIKRTVRRLDRRIDQRLHQILVRLFGLENEGDGIRLVGGNALRFSILASLLAGTLSAAFVSSCKSRYGFTNQDKLGGSQGTDGLKSATPPPPPVAPPATEKNPEGEPPPAVEGGPVAGIEAWQNGKMVGTLVTGVEVLFKLTPWTRDTSETTGCDTHKGIVQVSWAIGSRPSEDIQRLAGQDCRSFDYAGTFVKPGSISVTLDVVSANGEQAQAQASFPVTGEPTPTIGGTTGPTDPTDPTQQPVKNTPAQK